MNIYFKLNNIINVVKIIFFVIKIKNKKNEIKASMVDCQNIPHLYSVLFLKLLH